jgi:hypothetical protein
LCSRLESKKGRTLPVDYYSFSEFFLLFLGSPNGIALQCSDRKKKKKKDATKRNQMIGSSACRVLVIPVILRFA